MPGQFTRHGLPTGLAQDAWWLGREADRAQGRPGTDEVPRHWLRSPGNRSMGLLMLLVLICDWLFWAHAPGISLAVFAGAVFAAVHVTRDQADSLFNPALLMIGAVLPVVEHVQALSLMFLVLGGLASLVWLRLPEGTKMTDVTARSLGFAVALPRQTFAPLRAMTRQLPHLLSNIQQAPDCAARPRLRRALTNWGFPLGGTLVLASLLVSANPVLEQALAQVFSAKLDLVQTANRIAFWAGAALMCRALIHAPQAQAPDWTLPAPHLRLGINAGSVLRALFLFNALLAVQTLLDLSILFGGAALPKGMSYASYAHRGAYPLLATAILAGGFALAARPFAREHRWLTPLLMLWLGQNVLLCLSSMLRLELYVEAYGLTYLRIYAMIWMGLVATGLALTAWQILRRAPTAWLLSRACGVGAMMLYACCFVNFAEEIAHSSVDRAARGYEIDSTYLCDLGPMAFDAVKDSAFAACIAAPRPISGWQEWTFRAARVAQ